MPPTESTAIRNVVAGEDKGGITRLRNQILTKNGYNYWGQVSQGSSGYHTIIDGIEASGICYYNEQLNNEHQPQHLVVGLFALNVVIHGSMYHNIIHILPSA